MLNLYSQEPWMRPPAWRYFIVLECLADPTIKIDEVPKDPFLRKAVQYFRLIKDNKNTDKINKTFPIAKADAIHKDNRYGGWRWVLESLLISGCSYAEIKEITGIDCQTAVLKVYEKIFFDLENYPTDVAKITNIISQAQKDIDVSQVDCNYTWKLFALTWGGEAFIQQFLTPKKDIDKQYQKWFRDLTKDKFVVKAFHMASGLRTNYANGLNDTFRLANEYWNLSENDTEKTNELVDKEFVDALASHVEISINDATMKNTVEQNDKYDYSKVQI